MSGESEPDSLWDSWAGGDDHNIFSTADPAPVANFFAKLVGKGTALDLGAGTGRVAFALADKGFRVMALDSSPAMIAYINAERNGRDVEGVVGDMAEINFSDEFDLAYSTASTLFVLLDQEQQVDCFRAVAQALHPEGFYVVDAFVPIFAPAARSRQSVVVRSAGSGYLNLSATLHDAATQRISFSEVRFEVSGSRLLPMEIRYASPAEIDLMAALAGMKLIARYGDWNGSSFGFSSRRHVSVYQVADDGS